MCVGDTNKEVWSECLCIRISGGLGGDSGRGHEEPDPVGNSGVCVRKSCCLRGLQENLLPQGGTRCGQGKKVGKILREEAQKISVFQITR